MDNFDDSTTPKASPSTAAERYALDGKIMLCIIVVLFVAIFAILGFHSYARWFIHCRRRRFHLNHDSSPPVTDSSSGGGGLNVSVLKSLCLFTFASSRNGDDGQFIECAVCLSDFKDGEMGRRLPKCEHIFHADCIDTWFKSHSSCPLCRAPVQADSQATADVAPPVAAVGAAAAQGVVWLIEVAENETTMGSSLSPSPLSSSSYCGSCSSPQPPTKAVELEEITVEEPPPAMEERYKELEKVGLPEHNRSKSPAYRILSLKRICSI